MRQNFSTSTYAWCTMPKLVQRTSSSSPLLMFSLRCSHFCVAASAVPANTTATQHKQSHSHSTSATAQSLTRKKHTRYTRTDRLETTAKGRHHFAHHLAVTTNEFKDRGVGVPDHLVSGWDRCACCSLALFFLSLRPPTPFPRSLLFPPPLSSMQVAPVPARAHVLFLPATCPSYL